MYSNAIWKIICSKKIKYLPEANNLVGWKDWIGSLQGWEGLKAA